MKSVASTASPSLSVLPLASEVTRKRSDVYCFTINGGSIAAKVREQPDGSLYVTVGRLSQHLKGKEEADDGGWEDGWAERETEGRQGENWDGVGSI